MWQRTQRQRSRKHPSSCQSKLANCPRITPEYSASQKCFYDFEMSFVNINQKVLLDVDNEVVEDRNSSHVDFTVLFHVPRYSGPAGFPGPDVPSGLRRGLAASGPKHQQSVHQPLHHHEDRGAQPIPRHAPPSNPAPEPPGSLHVHPAGLVMF